jgi:ubiquinone/menaquinone biosynthesis C-methylase UbiE
MPGAQVSRVTRSKPAARQAYNRLSRWYDLLAGSSEQRFMKLGISQLKPTPGERILEIGCGTGHGLLLLTEGVSPSGSIFGLDHSEGMLAQTQGLLRRTFQDLPISLQLGDGSYLPYAAGVFSAIFFSFTLELFDTPDISKVLSESNRVLKPGGRIGIVCLSSGPGWPVRLYEWFHWQFPAIVDCRPILIRPDLAQAGFDIMEIQTLKMWGLPVDLVTATSPQSVLEVPQ